MTFLFSPARLWAIGLLFSRRIERLLIGEERKYGSCRARSTMTRFESRRGGRRRGGRNRLKQARIIYAQTLESIET